MARALTLFGLGSLVIVDRGDEIDDLVDHPALHRSFEPKGPLLNRLLARSVRRQIDVGDHVLLALRPRHDTERIAGQASLLRELDAVSDASYWPAPVIAAIAHYVVTGRRRRAAEAAVAYAFAKPFLPDGAQGDTAVSEHAINLGGRLVRAFRVLERQRSQLSLRAMALRLIGADVRARRTILKALGGRDYGLHAIANTLPNAFAILDNMRDEVTEADAGARPRSARLAWAAVRSAPAVIMRQTREAVSLPHVSGRLPPHTLVLLRMRRGLRSDSPSGYEFASAHWSHCPAQRYVKALFEAVAKAAEARIAAGEVRT